ncbi:MAG: hypothetical protein R3323_09635 [Wenzhouxiangellaceae bacterium]|nr:hypothetical protein [Wenzhouxiangellaceae bacterium]
MHQNLLQYRRSRYLWVAVALLVASIVLYLTQDGDLPPNGGSWQGYTLGIVGALLIVWLSLLGIRKRSYRSTMGTVEGWTSAHVYLGAGLLVIATLHSAFQFGFNVHTLLYVLMVGVILSGFFGLFVYMSYPRRLARVRSGRRRKDWLTELNGIDVRIHDLAKRCSARTLAVVESALDRTRLGGGVFAQLTGRDRSLVADPDRDRGESKLVANPDQEVVIDHLSASIPRARKREEALVLQELLGLFGRRRTVLRRLRQDIRLQGWMWIWLFFHVPLTVAVLAALVVHVLAVFVYW